MRADRQTHKHAHYNTSYTPGAGEVTTDSRCVSTTDADCVNRELRTIAPRRRVFDGRDCAVDDGYVR